MRLSSPTMSFTRCLRGVGGGELEGEGSSWKTVKSSSTRRGAGIGVEDDLLEGAGFKTRGTRAGRLDPARMLVGMGAGGVTEIELVGDG